MPVASALGAVHAPFEIFSVHFDFPGGQAAHLRDPVTDCPVGMTPEWVVTGRNEPAAYARSIRPQIQVVFQGGASAAGNYVIGADGPHLRVTEQPVSLSFDSMTGLSAPVTFAFDSNLPNQIGKHAITFDWYARDANPSLHRRAGVTSHFLCTIWRPLSPNPAQGLLDWVYSPLVDWTCQWAAGRDSEKDICDAIIGNLTSCGLKYGIRAARVRDMLLRGGGMCGVWYQMFQQLAHSQGIFVHRRCFRVDWRAHSSGEEHWCALVIQSGGLNQSAPTHGASEFHDHDAPFPGVGTAALDTRVERRYRFWGNPAPGIWGDGHCINFLEHQGRLYLYDACFGTGPFEIDGPLPPEDLSVWGGTQLSSFKARYLDTAVEYMLGSLYNAGQLCRSHRATSTTPATNGVTVRTAQIPETINGIDGLTFGWSG